MLSELREQWGVQALWDAWAVRGIVGGMDYLVPQTLLFIPLAEIIRNFRLGDTLGR